MKNINIHDYPNSEPEPNAESALPSPNHFEDNFFKEMAENLKGFVPVKGCRVCDHEIIKCRNHTHCSSLGMELICNCEECGGTGKPQLKPEHKYVWYSICSMHGGYTDSQCVACHSGSWVDEQDSEVIADRQLFKDDPDLWIDKHNPCPCVTCSGYCACKVEGHHKWEKSNESKR